MLPPILRIYMKKIGRHLKKGKKKWLKIALFFSVISIFFVSTAYALSTQLFTISGSALIVDYGDCPADINYAYSTTSQWGDSNSGYTYQNRLSITNNSNSNIEGWTIMFKGPSDLTINSFTTEATVDQGEVTLSPTGNFSWNASINAGATLNVDYQVHTLESELNLEYLYFNSCMIITGGGDSPLRDFSVSPSHMDLQINQTSSISTQKMPIDAHADFSFTSDNTSIATVNSQGVVTGVSAGDTNIRATANGITRTVSVTVSSSEVSLTSLSVSPKDNKMKVGDEKTLTVTKEPADAGNTITFSSSNPSVATVDSNGKVTAVSVGRATITVSGGSLTDTASVEVIRELSNDDIEATFSYSYYSDTSIHFAINLANIGQNDIHKITFKISFPSGTTWNYWNNWPAIFSANSAGTTLTSTNSSLTLESGSFINFTGSVTLPSGYSSSDYLSPTIYDIEVE